MNKMKNNMNLAGVKTALVTLVVAALSVTVVVAENYSVSVITSSTVLVPRATVRYATTWTNNLVVAQGDYVVNTNTTYIYFAVAGGTSTNLPTHVYGIDTTSDAVEWLKLSKNQRRKNSVIFADTAATVYYTSDGTDATTAGSVLDALRPARGFPGNDKEVKAIVSSGTATVNVELTY